MASAAAPTGTQAEAVLDSEKKSSHSTSSIRNEKEIPSRDDAEALVVNNGEAESPRRRSLVRVVSLVGLALLILGWWISSITLHATRHRWVVQTIFAWAFILIIAFRFIPNSVVTRPVEAVWVPLVQEPFFRIPKYVRFAFGWLSIIAVVLGSAFGFKLQDVRMPSHRRRAQVKPHLLIHDCTTTSGNQLWRSRHFRHGARGVSIWFLGNLEEPVRYPMAHRYHWSLHPTGDCHFRTQIRRWLAHFPLARKSRFRLPCPGPRRRYLLLRRRHHQQQTLVLCQCGMLFRDL
jgi:hypothetical protein